MFRRLATLGLLFLAPVWAQLPAPYRAYEQARQAEDAGGLERLLAEPGYVQVLAARALSRMAALSPSRRLELAERAARFENAAGDWLWVGRLREVLGDAPGAAEAYGKALPEPEAEAALVRLARAGVRRAYAALYAGRAYEALLDALPAEGEAAWRARALAGLHRYAEALPHFRAWARDSREGRLALGRLLLELKRYAEAEAAFRDAGGAAGAFGRGRALEALGRSEAAVRAYLEARTPEALWRATALLERAGRAAEALPLYRELATGDSQYADDATLRLWVLARRRGDAALEAWAYARLDGGLGLLAGRPYPRPPSGGAPPVAAAGAERAEALFAAGREAWAWGEARWWARRYRQEGRSEQLAAVVAELERWGWWGRALRLLHGLPLRDGGGDLLRLAYPRAYPGIVEAEARAFGLEPELLWAVMRVESRFDPEAVSPTGAKGLMQFVAATWSDVARRLGEEGADPFDPEAAVRFGAYYLRHLLDVCDRELVCALAGYNGGPGYTRRALAAEDGDVWDFLRFQPRDEPREYVERVLWAYQAYKALYRAAP
ncbi:Lytic transglycosylase catalytic [Oceanithermus profundus DSM 14977]|uniref:Lytic transglycosylase catalytic n=1 Tax=Oceanithermus profundus (strain DSM 14977 / NBRC 100410 / VKM B-2274 / 506) TaxID=670487 RepID=E4U9Y4_OCEP5|nr:lytic transglycosylase domain-containing protein [Oceanithermus profundus]ADR37298.1 Lytic transglycosylase catalytic [Oceanithermus profundus DSM 14977]